ncbi:hypothetical protein NLX83_04735 [Allokutzneria sp. A3M-2-11 16]|uniref:hypothetical protein n=1 Tax=Allokutzneria sp. A3M-2-11 16 TaxID=2962043 RepID=UPI0020B70CF2|nr:hypothetical protein [Allokutzneria sp. A3M-2-11 16]MCP3798559.1 hypothetical protein [Allokutzneria sp. A3M-2-11 16]
MTAPQGPGWPGQPGPQGPYQPGPPYPRQQPYPYPPQQPPPAPPRPRRGRTALIVSLVVVLVAGLGVGGWALFGGGGADSSQAGGGKGQERTEADVVKMDPKKLLDELITTLLTQPVVHTRIESVVLSQIAPYLAGQPYEGKIVEGGFDYRQRKMNFLDETNACVDGAKRRVRYDGAIAEAGPCDPIKGVEMGGKIGNGLFPGGMNETQAQAFLAYLHKSEGFLNPGKPTVVPREGKQYVRFPVVFSVVETSSGRAGSQIFIWAFQQTKLSFDDHPYYPMGNSSGTTEMVFYLDPKTLLPAYSEQLSYEPKYDPTGAEGSARRVEYLWDGKLPVPETSQLGKPKGPSWPSERLKPGQLK